MCNEVTFTQIIHEYDINLNWYKLFNFADNDVIRMIKTCGIEYGMPTVYLHNLNNITFTIKLKLKRKKKLTDLRNKISQKNFRVLL